MSSSSVCGNVVLTSRPVTVRLLHIHATFLCFCLDFGRRGGVIVAMEREIKQSRLSGAVLDPDSLLIAGYERLASLDLASIGAAELAVRIEAEAVAMLGLREAQLIAGQAPPEIEATSTGMVIPLPGFQLVGDGMPGDGWEGRARL